MDGRKAKAIYYKKELAQQKNHPGGRPFGQKPYQEKAPKKGQQIIHLASTQALKSKRGLALSQVSKSKSPKRGLALSQVAKSKKAKRGLSQVAKSKKAKRGLSQGTKSKRGRASTQATKSKRGLASSQVAKSKSSKRGLSQGTKSKRGRASTQATKSKRGLASSQVAKSKRSKRGLSQGTKSKRGRASTQATKSKRGLASSQVAKSKKAKRGLSQGTKSKRGRASTQATKSKRGRASTQAAKSKRGLASSQVAESKRAKRGRASSQVSKSKRRLSSSEGAKSKRRGLSQVAKSKKVKRGRASSQVAKSKRIKRRPAFFKSLESQKSYQKPGSGKKAGWRIPYIKITSLLSKMRLKKGDIIYSVNGQIIRSKKQFYQKLSPILKKRKSFFISIQRDKSFFLISYKINFSRGKRRFRIARLRLIKNPSKAQKEETAFLNKLKQTTQSKTLVEKGQKQNSKTGYKLAHLNRSGGGRKKQSPSGQTEDKKPLTAKNKAKNKKPLTAKNKAKNKKILVPKKYRAFMQRAYVAALNSFVYQEPDFDSPQIYPLKTGQEILISKKIFRPSHHFGSFYKAFLFSGKKIVGYISEAELVPEFKKQNGKYTANPTYKLAKKQMIKDKVLDLDLAKPQKPAPIARAAPPSKPKSYKKRYAGLSAGFLSDSLFAIDPKNLFFGIKLSGYDLLISYLNMDLNLETAYDFSFLHFDILTAYPLLKSSKFYLLAMGGLKTDVNRKKTADPVDYGVLGALSLALPLSKNNKGFLFRISAKMEYGFRSQTKLYGLSSSLQIPF